MNLQFADFNKDGQKDIVTATWEGTSMVVYGSKDGWMPQQHIVDENDNHIVLSRYYDMEEHSYLNKDCSPTGRQNAEDHNVFTSAYDWDNDGDLDLLIGAKEGRVYLRENLGNDTSPRFESVNHLLTAGDGEFMIPGGITAARPFDWDKDGDDDFICGSFKGGLYLVENTGKKGKVKLAAPVKLMGDKFKVGGDTFASVNWYADLVDYNGDGKTDLLVGMHASKEEKRAELTEAEVAEYDKAQARIQEIQAEMMKLYEPIQKLPREEQMAAIEELRKDEAVKKTDEEMMKLFERSQELRPMPMHKPGVWVFHGK